MSVKVSAENQTGQPYITDGYSGILYAAKAGYEAQGFAVLNNSWGGLGYNQYEQTTINVAHDNYHAVIVAAAGNGDDDSWGELYSPHYPSSYDNVISVCPTGSGDSWNHWATYHETVDIAAPGEGIRSCIINNGYQSWSGSSMASPIVASTFGLAKSLNPAWNNIQLETMILATADPVLYNVNQENYLEGKLGSGRIDAEKVLETGLFPKINYVGEDVFILDGNDDIINPGESIEMLVILLNDEDWGVAWNVSAEFSCDSPHVNVQNGTADFWDMEPGDVGLNETDPLLIEFLNTLPAGELECNLHVESNQIDWVGYSEDLPIMFTIESGLLYGDLNEDEDLDVLDVLVMVNIIMGVLEPTNQQELLADVNGDGIIDVIDVIVLVETIVSN